MGDAIEHFIWGYQPHFRISQQLHAKAVFKLLDRRFEPEVFLVGVLVEDRPDRHSACVEPEDDFWIPSEAFAGVLEAAKSLPATYPESQMFHSHPRVQEGETQRLWHRAVHETIHNTIAEYAAKPEPMLYFPSFPVKRDAYLVSTVLGLQEEVINSHARLCIDSAQIHELRSFEVATSLIDAAISEFLKDAASELGRPDAGEGLWSSGRTPAELIRSAGARFALGCAYKADQDSDLIGYWHRLFDACNSVAALKYEQEPSRGRLIVARRNHPALKPAIMFREPITFLNSRGTRKLLELASGSLALHVNARFVFGLVEVGEYEAECEDLFEINILGDHQWELAHAGHTLMQVHSGQPQLLVQPFDKAKLRIDLMRVFDGLSPNDADRLVKLVGGAMAEKHGTMLVVVKGAAQEARRLARQATVIEACPATPELVKQFTPIDGAILLSPDGVCHAIGVILDGLATSHGDPTRGARFNSALRYVGDHTTGRFAIVISEDGGVDLLPDLRPTIRRAEVERVIAELEVIAEEPAIRRRRFNDRVDWIKRHAFYLLPEHCQKVNELIEVIDNRVNQADPSGFQIVRNDFTPSPGFDPAFYYDAE